MYWSAIWNKVFIKAPPFFFFHSESCPLQNHCLPLVFSRQKAPEQIVSTDWPSPLSDLCSWNLPGRPCPRICTILQRLFPFIAVPSFFFISAAIRIFSHSSLIVSEIAVLQILLAGASGASKEANNSSASIPPMEVRGICHAVPQYFVIICE